MWIKEWENTKNLQVRTAYGKLAGVVGIICNILLFAGKFFVGIVSGSVAISGDALNNLSDASSNVISLIGFKMGSKPADEDHPYGHARYEYLAGLTVAVLIMVIGVELLKGSVEKILHPEPVEFSAYMLGILVVSVLVKLWMMVFNGYIGKVINSDALRATAADSRNDAITTLAVLVGSIIGYFTKLDLDPYMGIVVAGFILYSGFGLVKDTLDPIIGHAPDEELVRHIQEKILSYPGVLGTHDLMIHDYGPGRLFASVHVEMAAEEDVLKSHDMIDNIERDFLEQEQIHMLIHFDPIVTNDEIVGDMRKWMKETVKSINEKLTIHDFRMVPGPTHTNMIFDCVVPRDNFGYTSSELKAEIQRRVDEVYPGYHCVITVEHSFAPIPHDRAEDKQ